jgi:hypothetical protein
LTHVSFSRLINNLCLMSLVPLFAGFLEDSTATTLLVNRSQNFDQTFV